MLDSLYALCFTGRTMVRRKRPLTPPTNHPPTLPHVLPFKQAALTSGFSYSSLRDAHFRGDLAVIRLGRAWYVSIDELARFVEAHTERRAG